MLMNKNSLTLSANLESSQKLCRSARHRKELHSRVEDDYKSYLGLRLQKIKVLTCALSSVKSLWMLQLPSALSRPRFLVCKTKLLEDVSYANGPKIQIYRTMICANFLIGTTTRSVLAEPFKRLSRFQQRCSSV